MISFYTRRHQNYNLDYSIEDISVLVYKINSTSKNDGFDNNLQDMIKNELDH